MFLDSNNLQNNSNPYHTICIYFSNNLFTEVRWYFLNYSIFKPLIFALQVCKFYSYVLNFKISSKEVQRWQWKHIIELKALALECLMKSYLEKLRENSGKISY